MNQNVLGLTGALLLIVLLQITGTVSAKADPRECEVCISVLSKFVKETPEEHISDKAKLEKKFEKFCKELKGREHKVCWFLGAVENAPTRVVGEMSKPLSFHMPVEKVCEKLKKVDPEICSLRYEKQVDLVNANFKKMRVNELKKILSVWGEDNACKGCMEKSDFIKEIERLMPKYDPEAHKKRMEKSEL